MTALLRLLPGGPVLRAVALMAGAVALLSAWTLYHRHDAVADFRAELAARNAEARAEDLEKRQENANEARDLDDDALRGAIPQRLRAPD